MSDARLRPYHHGRLRAAALDAVVAEVLAVGAGGASMREIARRAGVTHAALAYQFGDKAGLFTEVAVAGFRLAADQIGAAAQGSDAFLDGGAAYVAFALTHPAHFEVMFRPDLCRAADPALHAARDAAFAVLYGSARAALDPNGESAAADADVADLAAAGWSFAHGFATLWLTANLPDRLGNPADVPARLTRGLAALGDLARRRSADSAGRPQ